MFTSSFSIVFAILSVLLHFVSAVPLGPTQLIAFGPTITSPSNGTVWIAGSNQTVTWRTDNIPDAARSHTLEVLLGYLQNDSENLDTDNPLATGVSILDGTVTVTVPSNATYRDNYIIVLIGTSGDASPTFTITLPSNTSVPLH